VNKEAFVKDEIVPVSQGGDPNDFNNVAAAHWRCNALRGDMSVEEFRARYVRNEQPKGEQVEQRKIKHSRKW